MITAMEMTTMTMMAILLWCRKWVGPRWHQSDLEAGRDTHAIRSKDDDDYDNDHDHDDYDDDGEDAIRSKNDDDHD